MRKLWDRQTVLGAAGGLFAEVAVQKRDKSEALRACLQKLSPEHREVIDLVYYTLFTS